MSSNTYNITKHEKNAYQQQQQGEQLVITNSYSKISMNINKKYSNRKTIYTKHYKPINIQKTSSQINHFDNKSASVVNLQFQQGRTSDNVKGGCRKTPFKGLNTDKRANYTTIQQASKKIANIYKQNSKSKYQQLFKQSVNDFFKNTLQIGPYVKGIYKQKDILSDPIAQRKLLNIQKASFPYRQSRPLTRGKTAYTRLSKDSSVKVSSRQQQPHQRIKSFIKNQNDGILSDRRQDKIGKKKNLLEALIPVRKPNNKKDYFVFGMADRTCTTQNKIEMFRDLLWKVNYSNNLFVFTPEVINNQSQTYKFYIGPGNNCNLIKGILKRRFWWTITSNKNQQGIHFIWTQLKLNQFFKQQQPKEITNYQSTKTCIDSEGEQPMDGLTNPTNQCQFNEISKVFNSEDVKNWRQHYKKNQKSQKSIQQNTYKRRSKLYQKKCITKIQQSTCLRMHNHLISNFFIGNKKALFYNIKHFSLLQQKSPFIFIPHTFHLKKGTSDPQYQTFLKYFTEMQSQKKTNKTFKNMWIVKPGQNTNRGNGITVAYGLDDIRIRLNGRERNRDGQFRTFIIQKYIQNPMLYNKRKFDIRHYALITCINGIFKFYWYEEGYIRTSSSQFNMKVNRDPLIHLTNDAIQKNTPDYGKYEKGNKLSYQDFQKYLETTYPTKKYNLFDQILPKMKQYAGQAFKASYSILDQRRLGHNFQLLGLDFMIDQQFQPWLIQINTNPCLQLSSPLLARLIPSLIQNVTRLTLDPLFPPPQYWPANKRTFFSEDPLSENKFTLVFDQMLHGNAVRQVFKDGKTCDANMGKIEEEDQTYQDDGKEDWEDKDKKETQ